MDEIKHNKALSEPITLPDSEDKPKIALQISNAVSKYQCQTWIKQLELLFAKQKKSVSTESGIDIVRIVLANQENEAASIVQQFYVLVRAHLPTVLTINQLQYQLVGPHEKLRFLKYRNGDCLAPHYDSSSKGGDEGSLTLVTAQLYLNDDFSGSETRFLHRQSDDIDTPKSTHRHCDIKPKTGRVVIHDLNIYHEAVIVTEGIKYVMRIDILYKPIRSIGIEPLSSLSSSSTSSSASSSSSYSSATNQTESNGTSDGTEQNG